MAPKSRKWHYSPATYRGPRVEHVSLSNQSLFPMHTAPGNSQQDGQSYYEYRLETKLSGSVAKSRGCQLVKYRLGRRGFGRRRLVERGDCQSQDLFYRCGADGRIEHDGSNCRTSLSLDAKPCHVESSKTTCELPHANASPKSNRCGPGGKTHWELERTIQ
jgi:hypothetical protein